MIDKDSKIRHLSSLLFSIMLALATVAEAKSEERKLTFATGYPTGRISVISSLSNTLVPGSTPRTAIGTVTVDVPPSSILSLDINPRCIEHPEKLANLPTVGIDQIYMAYMSMDDKGSVCDRALSAMPLFKHPIRLTCPRSDVTDTGLLSFKSLNMVENLDCFLSGVDGSFLKETTRLQNLKSLSLSNNGLNQSNLKALTRLQKLENIDFAMTDLRDDGLQAIGQLKNLKTLFIAKNPRLTDAGVQSLQQCTKLKMLNLAFNKTITDNSISSLQKLSQLTYLNLDSTKITASALEKLKDLKLTTLVLPQHYWRGDMTKLKKTFRAGVIKIGAREITKDVEVEYAPLK